MRATSASRTISPSAPVLSTTICANSSSVCSRPCALIEHEEIAAYGTDVALAEALGEKEVADLLSQTLEEEKQTDLKLTEVTQKAIMPEALAGEEEEGGDERGGGRSGGRRKAA